MAPAPVPPPDSGLGADWWLTVETGIGMLGGAIATAVGMIWHRGHKTATHFDTMEDLGRRIVALETAEIPAVTGKVYTIEERMRIMELQVARLDGLPRSLERIEDGIARLDSRIDQLTRRAEA